MAPLRLRPGQEILPLGVHDLGLLLAHGLAEKVGLGQGEAAELDGDPHDLFLVDDQAARFLEDRLELGDVVDDLSRGGTCA